MFAVLRSLSVTALLMISTMASADALSSYMADAHALDTLMGKGAKDGSLPQLSDTQAGALIARLTDANMLTQVGPYSRKQLNELARVCGQAQHFRSAYPDFGFSKSELTRVASPVASKVDPILDARINANVSRYQNEIVQFEAFGMHCVVAFMGELNTIAAEPGLSQNVMDSSYVFEGRAAADIELIYLIGELSNPRWSAANRQRLLDTMDAAGAPIALGMPPEWRSQLVQDAKSAQTRLTPADAHRLDAFVANTEHQPCGPLCKAPMFNNKGHLINPAK